MPICSKTWNKCGYWQTNGWMITTETILILPLEDYLLWPISKARKVSGLEDKEQREHFRHLVTKLPPKQRAILELRIHEQLSYEEIATMSNRSVSTIKASVFFALEKLRKLVKEPLKVRS